LSMFTHSSGFKISNKKFEKNILNY